MQDAASTPEAIQAWIPARVTGPLRAARALRRTPASRTAIITRDRYDHEAGRQDTESYVRRSRQNETVTVVEIVRGAPSQAAFSVIADR